MRRLKVNINSESINEQPYHYIHALGRYNLDMDKRIYGLSTFPAMPDSFQKYNEEINKLMMQLVI